VVRWVDGGGVVRWEKNNNEIFENTFTIPAGQGGYDTWMETQAHVYYYYYYYYYYVSIQKHISPSASVLVGGGWRRPGWDEVVMQCHLWSQMDVQPWVRRARSRVRLTYCMYLLAHPGTSGPRIILPRTVAAEWSWRISEGISIGLWTCLLHLDLLAVWFGMRNDKITNGRERGMERGQDVCCLEQRREREREREMHYIYIYIGYVYIAIPIHPLIYIYIYMQVKMYTTYTHLFMYVCMYVTPSLYALFHIITGHNLSHPITYCPVPYLSYSTYILVSRS
jgi:hypothetical protein